MVAKERITKQVILLNGVSYLGKKSWQKWKLQETREYGKIEAFKNPTDIKIKKYSKDGLVF